MRLKLELKFIGATDSKDASSRMQNPRGGPPVQDVGPANIGLFAQGSFLLVKRDIEEGVPAAAADELLGICSIESSNDERSLSANFSKSSFRPLLELERAYLVRRNVVSLKKVAQHIMLAAERIEDDLARGCTWHFKNTVPSQQESASGDGGGGYTHHPTYALLAGQHAAAKGAVCAVQDLRTVTKALACAPRYCGSSTGDGSFQLSPLLRGDFRSLRTAALLRMLERQSLKRDGVACARAKAKSSSQQLNSEDELAAPGGDEASAADANVEFTRALNDMLGPLEDEASVEASYHQQVPTCHVEEGEGSSAHPVISDRETNSNGIAIARKLQHWRACGPEAARLLRCSVIARGGAKAILMRVLLARLATSIEERLLPAINTALSNVHCVNYDATTNVASAGDSNSHFGAAAHHDRATRELEACRSTWLEALGALQLVVQRGANYTLFAAADSTHQSSSGSSGQSSPTAALVVPRGFSLGNAVLDKCRITASRFNASIRSAIVDFGWPPVRSNAKIGAVVTSTALSTSAGKCTCADSCTCTCRDNNPLPLPPPPAFPSLAGAYPCKRCGLKLAKLWLKGGSNVCLRCDEEWRLGFRLGGGPVDSSDDRSASGEKSSTPDSRPTIVPGGSCPLATRACMKAAWCPHARKCFACEPHSCPILRSYDGDDINNDASSIDCTRESRSDCCVDLESNAEIAVAMPKASFSVGCGLVRGDGAEVAAMAEDLKACAVFLDFDRTLASTRRGQSPYPDSPNSKTKTKGMQSSTDAMLSSSTSGNFPVMSSGKLDEGSINAEDVHAIRRYSPHTIDEDLSSLCSWHPNVHVVTRNRHVEDIHKFLRDRGCLVRRVWHVGKGASKASVVLDPANWHLAQPSEEQLLPESLRPVVMFVDDDVREHLCPLFLQATQSSTAQLDHGNPRDADINSVEVPLCGGQLLHLHRVLFSRLVQTE